MKTRYDVIVIGAGAAGLLCAIEAGKRDRRVLVIERNAQPGRKIIISGGGRCNFTNIHTAPENFVSDNPHFAKSALARYTPFDFIELVRKHRIDFYEKKLGQLFCRDSSRQIVELLLDECRRARVNVRTGCSVTKVEKNSRFLLATTSGPFECDKLVIATGGLSFAKIGATDFGYQIARQFDVAIVPTRPSLVPLVLGANQDHRLAGISLDSVVSTNGRSFRENILFTHRGLSGPAILQISNYWEKSHPVTIDLLPDRNALELLDENRGRQQMLEKILAQFLPKRFVSSFLPADLARTPLSDLGEHARMQIAEKLNRWDVVFVRTEGFDRAEVTLGGVSTRELSSQTMEANKVGGLYFVGEVVDVTGWLGGYNFQWAWASGYAAGQAV